MRASTTSTSSTTRRSIRSTRRAGDRPATSPGATPSTSTTNSTAKLPGAFYLETCMILRTGTLPTLQESHTHSFDEYLSSWAPTPTTSSTWAVRWSCGWATRSTSSQELALFSPRPTCPIARWWSTRSTGPSSSSPPAPASTTCGRTTSSRPVGALVHSPPGEVDRQG